jgi:hypothetical protein
LLSLLPLFVDGIPTTGDQSLDHSINDISELDADVILSTDIHAAPTMSTAGRQDNKERNKYL